MKALTYEGPHSIGYSDVPDAAPMGDFGAVVQVSLCGICGSDLHIYRGHGFSPEVGYCVGHEAVGIVAAIGNAVEQFKVGDRVMVPASVGCGTCAACRVGMVISCERGAAGCYGIGPRLQGSQAEAVAVPFADSNLVKLGESISDEAAVVLSDNLPTAWFGARRARIAPGDTVAVVGLGPVGLMGVASAFAMGAARVLAVDLVADRRARAESLGAEPIDATDARAAVAEITKGRKCDAVLEAVGADATIQLSIDLAGVNGRVSVVGVNQARAFPFDMQKVQVFNLEFTIGLCSVQYELPTLLRLVSAGKINPEVVVSHRMQLQNGPGAYAMFADRTDGVSKVVLTPN